MLAKISMVYICGTWADIFLSVFPLPFSSYPLPPFTSTAGGRAVGAPPPSPPDLAEGGAQPWGRRMASQASGGGAGAAVAPPSSLRIGGGGGEAGGAVKADAVRRGGRRRVKATGVRRGVAAASLLLPSRSGRRGGEALRALRRWQAPSLPPSQIWPKGRGGRRADPAAEADGGVRPCDGDDDIHGKFVI